MSLCAITVCIWIICLAGKRTAVRTMGIPATIIGPCSRIIACPATGTTPRPIITGAAIITAVIIIIACSAAIGIIMRMIMVMVIRR